jgi:hypothetical protein
MSHNRHADFIDSVRDQRERKEKEMDDYQEELLESRAVEQDVPEFAEDATEL